MEHGPKSLSISNLDISMVNFSFPFMAIKSLVVLSLFFLFAFRASAESLSQAKLEKLVALRAQLDDLNRKINLKESEIDNDYQFLGSQLASLSLEKRLESLKNKALLKKYSEYEAKVRSENLKTESLKEPVLKVLAYLKAYVAKSMPFQKKRRLFELSSMKDSLLTNQKTTFSILRESLAFLDSEKLLAEKIMMTRQEIKVGERAVIADFIQIGMSQGYFKTSNTEYGYLAKRQNSYEFVLINDPVKVSQLENLFTSVSKGIDYGFFHLPVFLPGESISGAKL